MSRHLVLSHRPRPLCLAVICTIAVLSACKSGGGGSSEDPSYQSARTLPPLEVPPDLSQFPPSEAYSQPATETRVVATQIPEDSQPPVSEEIRADSQDFGAPSASGGGTAFSEDTQVAGAGGLAGIGEPDAAEENPEDVVPENITANLMSSESMGPYLSVTAPFHIIWQQLGLGLDMEQVSILDRDRTNGRYYIDCEAMEEEAEPGKKKRKGWFFGFGKERGVTEICLLNVAMEDGGQGDRVSEDGAGSGDIFLTTDDGKSVDPELANRFLERIQRHFG